MGVAEALDTKSTSSRRMWLVGGISASSETISIFRDALNRRPQLTDSAQ